MHPEWSLSERGLALPYFDFPCYLDKDLKMVKPEVKVPREKAQTSNSMEAYYQVKMPDEEKTATEDTEEVVVKFQDERQRRSPRSGIFICLLAVVLLVGFLVVFLIQKSKG